ncbi:MAG: hypothetical protein Q9169_003841 [Polycauliona sp. 2 TL-2023]
MVKPPRLHGPNNSADVFFRPSQRATRSCLQLRHLKLDSHTILRLLHETKVESIYSRTVQRLAPLHNRQICDEASTELYSSVFIFRDPKSDLEWLSSIGNNNVKRVQKIKVVVIARHYFWNRLYWWRLLHFLRRNATELRLLTLDLRPMEDHSGPRGAYGTGIYSGGKNSAGRDFDFLLGLKKLQSLQRILLYGLYSKEWVGYLAASNGIKVEEGNRSEWHWAALRRYQTGTGEFCPHNINTRT